MTMIWEMLCEIDHTAQPLINADSSNLSWYTGSGRVFSLSKNDSDS